MWPFPKKHFEWREPYEFRRALDAREASKYRWWTKPLAGCTSACTFLTSWGLAKLAGSEQAPSVGVAVLIALAGGFFLVYLTSWAYRIAPSFVMITDDRIYRIVGNSRSEWKFANILSYAVLEWPESRGLALVLGNGGEVVIGIPRQFDLSALENFLSGRGLLQMPSNEAMQRTRLSAGR